jgi:hypothetical protein
MDSIFNIDTFSRLLTYAIFVLAGYDLSKSIPRPKGPLSWVAFILVVVLAGYLGMKFRLITVSGYNVFLNEIILGLSTGFVAGFLIRLHPKFKLH